MFVVALEVDSEAGSEIDIDEACSLVNAALKSLAQTENVTGVLSRFGAWGDLQASVRPLSEIMSC